MSDREILFAAIRKALEPLPEKTPYPQWESDVTVSGYARSGQDTVEIFKERMQAAHGLVVEGWDELARLLRERKVQTGYMDETLLTEAGTSLEGFKLESSIERERIDDYAFGITRASGAIAETGSLILKDEDTPFRLAALAPWIHVAVVSKKTLFSTVAEAVEDFGPDPSVILITGPSKTADIEGILIEGVHGPGVQVCCLV